MGRIYTAQFNGVSISAQQDLFEILAPSSMVVLIHDLFISQITAVSDANEKALLLLLKSGQTTTGSGGTTLTPAKKEQGDSSAASTIKANNTTKASGGTILTHHAWTWNIRVPFQLIFTPETRPVLAPSRRATVELATTPASAITVSGTITFEEVG